MWWPIIFKVIGWSVVGMSLGSVGMLALVGMLEPGQLLICGVTSLFLAGAMVSIEYTTQKKIVELKKLQELQKLEGTIILKRGPRGRFQKAEVK